MDKNEYIAGFFKRCVITTKDKETGQSHVDIMTRGISSSKLNNQKPNIHISKIKIS